MAYKEHTYLWDRTHPDRPIPCPPKFSFPTGTSLLSFFTVKSPHRYHRFGYVPASLLSLSWVLVWQTFLVSRARLRAHIKYPQRAYNALHLAHRPFLTQCVVYAEQAQVNENPAANRFNCTQRSLSRVFQSFYRADLSTSSRGPSKHARGCTYRRHIVSSSSF